MRSALILSLAAAAMASPSFRVGTIHNNAAPLLSATNAEEIPNSYIIRFKKHVTADNAADHQSWVQKINVKAQNERMELRKRGLLDVDEDFKGLQHTYQIGSGFLGYSGHFDERTVEEIRMHPDVEYIEKDSIVHTMVPETQDKCDGDLEKQAPWGLARVSHREPLSFGTYNKYLYAHDAGTGVDIYIIDTGINTKHVDFGGRAHWGKTIPSGDADVDGNGHGTHCSGTAAGQKYGVAKNATVYAVKVLRSNGSGTMADVVKGVEWAANAHLAQVKAAKDGKRKGFKGSSANMSLGGGKTQTLDNAVNAAVDTGLHFAVAAGNDNSDACNYSPAAASKAITVGASALDDSRAYFSNWGKCTDIFGPGLSILSTWIGSPTAVNTISGTSMASPHICGLIAYYLSLQPAHDSEYSSDPISPEKLKSNMLSIATVGALSDLPKDTPNLLAWNGGGCSNYSSIVEAGSYTVKNPRPNDAAWPQERVKKLVKGFRGWEDKLEEFAKKLHYAIDEEVKEIIDEVM